MKTYNNKNVRQALIDRANNPAIKENRLISKNCVFKEEIKEMHESDKDIFFINGANNYLLFIKSLRENQIAELDKQIYVYLDFLIESENRGLLAHPERAIEALKAYKTSKPFPGEDLNLSVDISLKNCTKLTDADYPRKRYLELRDSYFLQYDLEQSLAKKDHPPKRIKI